MSYCLIDFVVDTLYCDSCHWFRMFMWVTFVIIILNYTNFWIKPKLHNLVKLYVRLNIMHYSFRERPRWSVTKVSCVLQTYSNISLLFHLYLNTLQKNNILEINQNTVSFNWDIQGVTYYYVLILMGDWERQRERWNYSIHPTSTSAESKSVILNLSSYHHKSSV